MTKISAIIVVKNSPPHLFEAIDSINDIVKEIIIGNVDVGNDYKQNLLHNKKVQIIDLPSDIPFADLVKEDLKKQAKGRYILYIDPDEIFPAISNQQLTMLLQKYDYFYFPRKNIIFGKWIQHSRWWPDYQLRLFKKDAVVWPRKIHPVPVGRGKEYRFEAKEENAILHYNYNNLDKYLEKAARYAKTEASLLKEYSLSTALKQAVSEFVSRYFADEGFKDGMHGFVLSSLQMFYYFLVYFYYWEYKKYPEEKELSKDLQNFVSQFNYETNFWVSKKRLTSPTNKLKLKIQNLILKHLRS